MMHTSKYSVDLHTVAALLWGPRGQSGMPIIWGVTAITFSNFWQGTEPSPAFLLLVASCPLLSSSCQGRLSLHGCCSRMCAAGFQIRLH